MSVSNRKLVSFDWALKRLLRSKANFEVLEGFLSELLKDDIQIEALLESESNKETASNKQNRVDLKVKNSKGELVIIEVQYERELDYMQRILFLSSKAICEHLEEGAPYAHVAKVISVNILHFNLGQGQDYVYHGTTRFKGIHEGDELELSPHQRESFGKEKVFEVYPEYYLLTLRARFLW